MSGPSYEELCHEYEHGISCPPDFSFPTHVIDKLARDNDKLLAIHWVSEDFSKQRLITYAELSALSHRIARVFYLNGIRKGDRVLVVLGRVIEWCDVLVNCKLQFRA